MPAFHGPCCQQRHGVTELLFPGKHSQGDWEPVPEEAACKRQTLSHDLFVRWAGENRDYYSLFSIMFRLQGFSLEGSEKEGARGIYNNLFCTCHFNVCLLPLWHSTRAFETQKSGKEYILKELLINSSLGLLSRKKWECLWLFLKGSSTKAIFFSGYHKSRIEGGKNPKQVTALTQQVT